jgi:hypothetical protein
MEKHTRRVNLDLEAYKGTLLLCLSTGEGRMMMCFKRYYFTELALGPTCKEDRPLSAILFVKHG